MMKLVKRLLAAILAVTVVLGSFELPTPAAQAAEKSISGITADGAEHYLMTQGTGSFSGKLPDGREVSIVNNSGVPTFTVGGVEYGTGVTNKVAWCSSILVWPTQALAFVSAIGSTESKGNLAVMDLKSNWNTMFWLTYDESTTSKMVTNRKVTYVAEGSVIRGNGVANPNYPTSIFYSFRTFGMMFGESSTAFVVEKELPTREELVDIYGIDPLDDTDSTPTPAATTSEPTQAPTQKPTAAPTTVAPATQKPVEVPTMAPIPTMKPVATLPPLEVPTLGPVVAPSVAPNQIGTNFSIEWWYEKYRKGEISWEQFYQAAFGVNIDTTSHTESTTQTTAEFYWQKFEEGKITWDQLTQLVWGSQWTITKETDGYKDTYYFYNEDKTVDHTREVWHEATNEAGTGTGSAEARNSGTAETQNQETGTGGANASSTTVSDTQSHTEVQGQATVANQGYAQWAETEVGHGVISGSAISTVGDNVAGGSSKTTSSAKKKVTWSVQRPDHGKGQVKLIRHGKDGKRASVCRIFFNPKKHVAKVHKTTYKNVDSVGYLQGSREIRISKISKKKAGYHKTIVVPRNKKKSGKVYKDTKLKGLWNKTIQGQGGLDEMDKDTATGKYIVLTGKYARSSNKKATK